MDLRNLPIPMEDGSFVNAKVSRIVELIREYDPRLDVKWIPPRARANGEAAFAITERTPHGQEQIVMHVQNDEDMDERVLARIYEGDNAKHDVQARLNAHNRAVKAERHRQWLDEMEERHDMARFMVRTHKHTIRHNGKKLDL